MKFRYNRPINWNLFKKEVKASSFLKYYNHFDEKTIITHDNRLIRIIEVNGFSFETADDEELDIKKDLRNSLFKGMANDGISLYFHIVRKKVKYTQKPNIDFPDGFAMFLENKWINKYKNKEAFVNKFYISIISSQRSSANYIDQVLKIFNLKNDENTKFILKELYDQLEEASNRVINTLMDYGVHELSLQKINEEYYSEVFSFLSEILNFSSNNKVMYSNGDMSSSIPRSQISFYNKHMEILDEYNTKKYGAIVSLKEYGPKTWAGIMDNFLKMQMEFVITQSFRFLNRSSIISSMQVQQNRMIQSDDKGYSQIIEINEALDKATTGEIGFGTHHISILCISDSLKELENYASFALVELSNSGGIGVRETINMEPSFWAQFPGNFDFIVRKSTINTFNLASFNSFHNYPSGKKKDNHWGDYVTILDTASGTPYYFNFHKIDVGHTMIVGPTGSGKTVLLNFLSAQSQKFRARLFFFDKDRGAEIFLRALNGEYTIIDPGKKCNFNPLKLEGTDENKAFLLEWLKLLVTCNGEQITAEDINILQRAIDGNYRLELKDRKLSNIAPFIGIGGSGSLAGRLLMWHSGGSLSNIFDNDEDVINFAQSYIFGFEMGEILQNKMTLAPVLLYIFHRINISLDGYPTMIVLDEAWALIDNPIFAPKIKDWLKVLRKLNTFMIFATQSVEDASKSQISDTLVQQTATQIFLPNLRATEVYRSVFMLTEREYALIKNTDPSSRYFLLKQGLDAIVARIDLSGMDDVISILSGRAETVTILDNVLKEYGKNPDIWISEFYKKIREMKDNI